MFYLYQIRDTDGNDCTVFDCVVEADSAESADSQVFNHFDSFGSLESDGDRGYFRVCACEVLEVEDLDDSDGCDSCEMLSINGTACHESGCPAYSAWKRAVARAQNFECYGHGGVMISEPTEFQSEEDADAARSRYHSNYSIC